MQGQARPTIEAVRVPDGRVMIEGTGLAKVFPRVDQLQRWLQEAFRQCQPYEPELDAAQPKLKSPKQDEIVRDRNTRKTYEIRSFLLARPRERTRSQENPAPDTQGTEMTCIRHLGRAFCNFGSRKPKL